MHFSSKGCCENVRVQSSRERRLKKTRQKVRMPITFVKGNYFGTPLCTTCKINKAGDKDRSLRKRGGPGGGGRGRYEARRVNAGFHVITCDLTAIASHLLVSAVPWIQITVSKSPFF